MFNLLRWFSFAALLSIALVSALGAEALSQFLAHSLMRSDSELSDDLIEGMLLSTSLQAELSQLVQSKPANLSATLRAQPSMQLALNKFGDQIAMMPGILRVNLYTPDNMVGWSTNPELIGRAAPSHKEFSDSLAGRPVVKLSDGDGEFSPDSAELSHRSIRFVEQYMPITGTDGHVIGVIELYKEATSLASSIKRTRMAVWVGASVSGLLVYLALLGVVLRGDRIAREQRTRLNEAEALSFVGELSAAVAHSVRNPLASIRSSAELQAELNPESRDTSHDIMRQVDRIEALLKTLLTYARDPSDLSGSADVCAAIHSAVDRFKPEFEKRGTELNVNIGASTGLRVRGESVLILQAIHSLLANAMEATGSGDRVSVSVSQASGPRRVAISIEDSGQGVPVDAAKNVFQPFFTTKPRGLGLGLALVKRIVERVGGSVELASTFGHGTRVTLNLPTV